MSLSIQKLNVNSINKYVYFYFNSQLSHFLKLFKGIDSNGNIPISLSPFTFDIDNDYLTAHLASTLSQDYPIRVDPSLPRQDIIDAVVRQHGSLFFNESIEDVFSLARRNLKTYGFGISLNSASGDITLVYAFGSNGQPSEVETNYRESFTRYSYVSRDGCK